MNVIPPKQPPRPRRVVNEMMYHMHYKCPACGCYLSHSSYDDKRYCPNHGEVLIAKPEPDVEQREIIAAAAYKSAFEEAIEERDVLARQVSALRRVVGKCPAQVVLHAQGLYCEALDLLPPKKPLYPKPQMG